MILLVGLTGGIASGKSTVARTFAQLGCHVVDADAIVASLYAPGAPGYRALVAHYGNQILRGDGTRDSSGDRTIDRPKLAALALRDDVSAKELNALIHPLVLIEEQRLLEAETRRLAGGDGISVVEATLLLEAGGRDRYDRVVVVDLPPEQQLERAIARGLSAAEASQRMARQMSREERLSKADYVIDNGGSAAAAALETEAAFDRLWNDLQTLKQNPKKTAE